VSSEAQGREVEREAIEQATGLLSHLERVHRGTSVVLIGPDQSGRRCAVKVYRRVTDLATVQALVAVQRGVAKLTGLTPRVLQPPVVLHGHVVTVEAAVDVAARQSFDVRTRGLRTVMAQGLCKFVEAATAAGNQKSVVAELAARPDAAIVAGTPFRLPHAAAFDFAATAHGAEWIDAIAWSALKLRIAEPSPVVVVHTDWRPENVILNATGSAVATVFDLDALEAGDEAWLVGGVARVFSTCWRGATDGHGVDFDPMIPTLEQALLFLADYELARAEPFTAEQRQRAHAGLASALAYSARCEHALPAGAVTWSPTFADALRLVAQGHLPF
jgi:Phosphotransferase enzyme family